MRTARSIVAGLFPMLIGSNALAAACDGFTDVDSANSTYCSAVTYLKDKGITLGCTGTTYCPNDFVTRLQMALFLQRMGKGGPDSTLGNSTGAIGGGDANVTGSGNYDVVGGGVANSATGGADTVSGGQLNTASGGESVVIGGSSNTAGGDLSVVLGGYDNFATAELAIAAGQAARADRKLCALFDLWASNGTPMNCGGSADVFRIGGEHGISVDYYSQLPSGFGSRWVTLSDLVSGQTIGTWTGAFLSDGGTWTNGSDRNAKTDFAPIDPKAVLDKVAALPIETWRYKVESGQVHLGPMAQDFRAAFGLGADDKHIATVDEGGVALAAIQGLNAKLEGVVAEQARELAMQSHELAEIKAQLASMAAAH